MWKRPKFKAIAVGVVAAFVCSIPLLRRKASEQELSIVFAGYTNSATGAPSANFVVSNTLSRVLFVSESGLVVKKEAGAWNESASTCSRVIALPPNETFIVNVPRPTDCKSWRVLLHSGQPRGSLRRRIGTIYEQQPFRFEPLTYLLLAPVLRHTASYSEEIKN